MIRTESSTAPTIRLFVPIVKMGRSSRKSSILDKTAEEALDSWPQEIKELKSIGRPRQADKLEAKLTKLCQLVNF